jgi:hypothetical protein
VAPGAKSSEIALRHGLHRNQLYDWRRQFRSAAVADAGFVASDFVPVVAENQGGSATAAIEIEIGGATLAGWGGGRAWLSWQGAAPVKGHEMIPALSGTPPTGVPSGTMSGQIQPTGNAHLTMDGLTGDPDYSLSRVHAGTPIHYTATAQFTARSGTGTRDQARHCDLAFSKI